MAGRTLTVFLAADTSKFRKGMNDAGDGIDGPTGLRGKVGNLTHSLNNMLGPAMLGAGLGAAVMAGKFAVDGVQGAIEQRAEIEKLALALDNLGLGAATQEVNDFIDAQARQTTFSDSQLRPAFALLAGATGSVTEAQDLLNIAMDIAVGTGKDLDSVVGPLAKAYNGNTGALGRLIPGLDLANTKSEDLFASTGLLAQRFEGQAAKAADTQAGKINEVRDAFGELQESFGEGFLQGLDTAESKTGDFSDALYDLQKPMQDVGKDLADLLEGFGTLVGLLVDGQDAIDEMVVRLGPLGDAISPLVQPLDHILKIVSGIGPAADAARGAIDWLLGRQDAVTNFDLGPITNSGGGVFR